MLPERGRALAASFGGQGSRAIVAMLCDSPHLIFAIDIVDIDYILLSWSRPVGKIFTLWIIGKGAKLTQGPRPPPHHHRLLSPRQKTQEIE